jgi:hypothetical protein
MDVVVQCLILLIHFRLINNIASMIAFDIRSIILFRVCFGAYILYDIFYTRLGFRWSPNDFLSLPIVDYHIPWYTQSNVDVADNSIAYLQVSDTPHQSYPHKIWFYRGSATFQYAMYALTCLMAIGYSLGVLDLHSLSQDNTQRPPNSEPPTKKTNSDSDERGIRVIQGDVAPYTTINTSSTCALTSHSVLCKCIFWVLVTSYQNRNMFVHDGSDTYTRLLLLYSCFIPLRFPKHEYPTYTATKSSQSAICTQHSYSVSSISTTSFSLQIALMYLGTVCCRTVDQMDYAAIFSFWHPTNEWLFPSLSAVYNALCIDTFATRDNLLTRFICSHYVLCQVMTFSAMMIEFCCPIFGLVLLVRRSRIVGKCNSNCARATVFDDIIFYGSILPLLLLHFGLLCCLRLPNWQSVAMIALLAWVPSSVFHPRNRANLANNDMGQLSQELASYKKTDGDPAMAPLTACEIPVHRCHHHFTIQSHSIFTRCVQYFLLFYMIYNFVAERHIIPKYDQGDIGEFFRISQYWVMYSTVGTIAHTTRIAGTISSRPVHSETSAGNYSVIEYEKSLDLLRFVATGGREIVSPMPILADANLSLASLRSSVVYPTVRWERALHTWSKDSYESQFHSSKKKQFERRLRFFGLALCRLVNKELIILRDMHFPTDQTLQSSWFSRKRRLHERFLQGLLNESIYEEQLRQQKDNASLAFFLKEIEIRFQHLQVLQRQNVQVAAPDSVVVVSCSDIDEEKT